MTAYNSIEAYFVGTFDLITKTGLYIPKNKDPYHYLDEIAVLTNHWTIDIPEIDKFTNSFLDRNPQYDIDHSYNCDFLAYILHVDGLLYNSPIYDIIMKSLYKNY
jgi:hypothetical protein